MAESYVEYLKNRRAQTNATQQSKHITTVENRYLRFGEDTHGTIGVRLEPSASNVVQLCEYTKVAMIKEQDDRTYFRIMDGPYGGGRLASMKSNAAKEVLRKTPPTISTETLIVRYGRLSDEVSPFKGTLRQQWATLSIGGQDITVTLNSIWNRDFTPIPQGRHRIMVPDGSHANVSTEGYRDAFPGKIKGNDAWFPIELQGTKGNSSRYVHIGHLSEGCVTVHDIVSWNTIYNFLISHRLANTEGKYVAMLEVFR